MQLLPVPGRRPATHRVPVRQAAQTGRAASAGGHAPVSGERAVSRTTARRRRVARRRRSAARWCSRRTRSRRTTGSRSGPRGAVLSAVRGVSLRLYRSARRRARRRERLGQVDRGEAARRPGAPDQRRDPARRCARRTVQRGGRSARYKSDVQMVFQDPFASLNPVHTVRYALRAGRPPAPAPNGRAGGRPRLVRLLERGAPDPAPSNSSRAIRTSCPAASASVSRSHARSPPSRACCSPTSPSRCSTSRSASRCST